MADFNLTQTDQQVQNILNDAQGAMGASAQTTLTTEYVMLKDTSGIYHKILKSSFTEAIRDVLAGLLVNNDKGTTISQIAAIASGDFGSVTPANLASVLGVFMFGNTGRLLSNGQDLNGINYPGLYASSQSITTSSLLNKPADVISGFVMVCSYPYGKMDYGTQIIIHAGTLFLRYNYGTSANPNWGGWKQLQLVE